MGLYEHFPYTNLQNLNLDWILEVVKDFKLKFESAEQWLADAIAAMSAAKDADIAEMAAELQTLLDQMQAQYNTLIGGFEEAYQSYLSQFQSGAAEYARYAQGEIVQQGEITLNSIPSDYQSLFNASTKNIALADQSPAITDFNNSHFLIGGYLDYVNDVSQISNGPSGASGIASVLHCTANFATGSIAQSTINIMITLSGHIYIRQNTITRDPTPTYNYGNWVTII